MSYFEELQHDWDNLGLFLMKAENASEATIRPADIETYADLHAMLHGLACNVHGSDYHHKHLRNADPETLGLRTELARHAVSLFKLDVFDRIPMHICGQAEALHARSMTPDRITNPERDSPVIITRADEPIGVVKQLGDVNYYALQDDVETATHAGHLYRTDLNSYYQPFVRESWEEGIFYSRKVTADTALTIPITDLSKHMSKGTQFSIFMVPTSARVSLESDSNMDGEKDRQRGALRTSHEFLLEIAEQALASAELIQIGYKYRPGTLPKGWQEKKINGKYKLVQC